MKGMQIALALLAFVATPVLAAAPGVSINEVTAAGFADARAVPAADGRFDGPVLYFRSSSVLSPADAKKDCLDCSDLLAVYTATLPTAPDWLQRPNFNPLRKVGGRWQLRRYLPDTKTLIIVTGADQAKTQALSDLLVAKAGT